MEDDEYELVSSEEVDRLKREIAHLKSNPFVQNSSDDRLYDAVRNLNDAVTKLYLLFENINKQLMKEYQTGESPEEKLDKLLDQNRNIAEALVTFVSKNDQMNDAPAPVMTQNEMPVPEMQQSMQMRTQMPPDPFAEAQMNQAPTVQMNQMPQMQKFNQVPQMQNFSQQPSQMQMNQQFTQPQQFAQPQQFVNPQMQEPIQQQRFGFTTKLDPNYPSPDNFPGLNSPPSFGEPINLEPKKKGFLGIGKK